MTIPRGLAPSARRPSGASRRISGIVVGLVVGDGRPYALLAGLFVFTVTLGH